MEGRPELKNFVKGAGVHHPWGSQPIEHYSDADRADWLELAGLPPMKAGETDYDYSVRIAQERDAGMSEGTSQSLVDETAQPVGESE